MPFPFSSALRGSAAVLLAVVLAWLAAARQCEAQTTLTWDANTGTTGPQDGAGTWNNQGNSNWWNPTTTTNVQWNNADVSDVAVFGSNTASIPSYAITVSGTIDAGGITFDAISNSAGAAYTFSGAGSSIVLTPSAVIDVMDNASSTGGRITFTTPLTANNLTIHNNDAGNVGFALLNLSGANSLTGTLTIQGNATGGIFVSATVANALNSGLTSVTVTNNSTLSLAEPAGTNYTQNFTITGNGSGARGAVRVDTGTSGTPTILSGNITLAASGAAIYSNANIVTNITGAIGDGGSGFAFDAGTATGGTAGAVVILSGNNTFTGGLRVDGDEVRLGSTTALNTTTPNVVSFTSNSINKVFTLNGNSVTAAGLVSSGGTGTITTQNASATAATLTIANSTATSYGGILQDGSGGGSLSLLEAGTAVQTVTGNVTLNGSITVNSGTLAVSGAISATSGIGVNSGGILSLSGNNTFSTGITLATGGTLNVNSATALGASTSVLTINGGTIDNSSSGGALTITNNNGQVWNGDFAFTGTHSLNLGTGNVSLGTTAGTTRTVATTSAATSLTVGGVISDGATVNSLTKSGAGTLVLTGANTYDGLTTVTAGILNIQNNNALGSNAVGTVINDGAKLQLQNSITVTGETLTTGFLESVSGANTWTGNITGPTGTQFTIQSDTGANLVITGNINGNGHTTILAGGGSGEISGVISNVFNGGNSGFNMTGTGTWILDGGNTYAAPTAVISGNLQVGKNGIGQTGTLGTLVSSGATLSGSGFIIGAATVTGTVSPGDNGGVSAGRLSFNSGLAFNPTVATTSAQLNLTSASSGDNIHVTGALTLNSNSNFKVTFDPAYTLNSGDSWDLMDWTGLLTLGGFNTGTNLRTGANVGNEGNLDLPDLTQLAGYSGQVWSISTLADGSTAGELMITITPEPSRALFLMFGIFAVLWRRRRN